MATHKQIQAARENGKKSRGPVTPEGKAASAKNAVFHGFRSTKYFVQNNEDCDQLDAFIADFTAEYQPSGPTETALVRDLAHAHFSLERIWAMQIAGVDYQVDAQRPQIEEDFDQLDEPTRLFLAFNQLAKESPGLALLNRYQVSYDRAFHRARKALLETQAARREREAAARRDESLLAEEIAAQSGPRSSASLEARISNFQANPPSGNLPKFSDLQRVPPVIIDLPRTRPDPSPRPEPPSTVERES
jgi:hypothetical protein